MTHSFNTVLLDIGTEYRDEVFTLPPVSGPGVHGGTSRQKLVTTRIGG